MTSADLDEFEFTVDPRVEAIVWRGLGVKPLKQIADETGHSRDDIIRIREEVLSSVDELTVLQKRQKLIMSLEEMSQVAREDYDNAPFEFKAGILNSAISAISKIQAELNRMSKADQSRVDELNQKRIRELVSLIREVVDTSVSEVAEAHDLPEDELFEVFNRNLEAAARKRDAL